MIRTFLFIAALSISTFSCQEIVKGLRNAATSKTEKDRPKKKEGVVKKYYDDGSLRTEINYSNGKKDGIAKEFYSNGKLKLEVTYKNGIKHGPSSFYYKDGKLYRETPYVNGRIEGIRKVYSKGKLIAEIPYKNGGPGTGLKEYYVSGKPKPVTTTMSITPIDNRLKNNTYILRMSFSEINPKDKFFVGELLEGKYLHEALAELESKNGVAEFTFEVPPGAFLMQKISLVGLHYTSTRNPYVVAKTYNLVIE